MVTGGTMGIDLSHADARKKFIEERFADVLANIKELYGIRLMNKLFDRLDRTIELFDQDVTAVFQSMEKREAEFVEKLPTLSELQDAYKQNLEQKRREAEAQKEIVVPEEVPAEPGVLDAEDSDIIHRLMKRRH